VGRVEEAKAAVAVRVVVVLKVDRVAVVDRRGVVDRREVGRVEADRPVGGPVVRAAAMQAVAAGRAAAMQAAALGNREALRRVVAMVPAAAQADPEVTRSAMPVVTCVATPEVRLGETNAHPNTDVNSNRAGSMERRSKVASPFVSCWRCVGGV
jgi:hypothetical protein